MLIAQFASGSLQANCYLLAADQGAEAIVIDPGEGASAIVQRELKQRGLTLAAVLLTHGHLDHCADAARLANEHQVALYCHRGDWAMLHEPMAGLLPEFEPYARAVTGPSLELPAADRLLDFPADSLKLGGLELNVLHSPGHSPGSVILSLAGPENLVSFTGDVIFAGSVGRSDLPGGDAGVLADSLAKLRSQIDPQTALLPGHGPTSTMAQELITNPYLQEMT